MSIRCLPLFYDVYFFNCQDGVKDARLVLMAKVIVSFYGVNELLFLDEAFLFILHQILNHVYMGECREVSR